MQPSPQLFVLIHFSYNCPKYVRKKKKPLKISGFCRVGRIALAHYPKLIPKAPADRTTARTCQEQKKPDYCRAFLSGWQDSNLRPPHPKCGAIPGYATPRLGKIGRAHV